MLRYALVLAFLAVSSANIHDRAYYEAKFFDWMKQHKIAAQSAGHFVQMLTNFANNDDVIETHNAKNLSYTLGHNQFSHMSQDEWREYVKLGLMRPEQTTAENIHAAPADLSTLADSIDWTTRGAVTPVKDQGQCGSCWSFSTTGALEGAYFNKYNSLKSFSEQNLVDCDTLKNGGRDMGCNGGLMDNAFNWIGKNGGLCSEADYPYVSGTTKTGGSCAQSSCSIDSKAKVQSHVDVQTNSDAALMSALNVGPVSVAIEADQSAFQLYKSGVFTASCGTNLDHGVLAVGYGTLNGVDYYKVKNSWGESWGDKGYILLQRGVSQKEGQCGILSGPPSYPKL
eukprot:CAMPEP_0202971278 /NCGR_PEP_ID=MMETSP1396-20130829/25553_1 /ASSEMBLY_ACC=CAM_ASM_000872 /TAXON_ID= /ORGANISM="Pseudokeronopsis sp., Strain Brazil" /LENGTH=339 /DNA_ID=CAMNT_0049700501 /DNA_START=61 /DNA_END=1080 /DNA_ORIENTATION=-